MDDFQHFNPQRFGFSWVSQAAMFAYAEVVQ